MLDAFLRKKRLMPDGQHMSRGTHRFPPMDRVVYGVPLVEALAEEIRLRDCRAVYVMASGTLARQTDVIDTVRHALGNRLAGVLCEDRCHTAAHRRSSRRQMRRARRKQICADRRRRVRHRRRQNGRVCALATMSRARTTRCLPRLDHARRQSERPPTRPPGVRFVAVADHSFRRRVHLVRRLHRYVRHVKESYGTALMMPSAVILDPAVTVHTPAWLFPVHRHPRRGSRGRGHLLDQPDAVLGWGVAARAAAAVARVAAVKADPGGHGGAAGLSVGGVMSIMGFAERRDQRREATGSGTLLAARRTCRTAIRRA